MDVDASFFRRNIFIDSLDKCLNLKLDWDIVPASNLDTTAFVMQALSRKKQIPLSQQFFESDANLNDIDIVSIETLVSAFEEATRRFMSSPVDHYKNNLKDAVVTFANVNSLRLALKLAMVRLIHPGDFYPLDEIGRSLEQKYYDRISETSSTLATTITAAAREIGFTKLIPLDPGNLIERLKKSIRKREFKEITFQDLKDMKLSRDMMEKVKIVHSVMLWANMQNGICKLCCQCLCGAAPIDYVILDTCYDVYCYRCIKLLTRPLDA